MKTKTKSIGLDVATRLRRAADLVHLATFEAAADDHFVSGMTYSSDRGHSFTVVSGDDERDTFCVRIERVSR